MNINEFLNIIPIIKLIRNNDGNFVKPIFDSRKAEEGDLFIAIKGNITDGHKYIEQVINKKVSIIVCETIPEQASTSVTWIQVECSSKTLAIIANTYFNNPSSKLKLIGITGTNGKTTLASSLYNLITDLGYSCGLISTNKILIDNEELPTSHTTPDPLTLNETIYKMVQKGCEYCFMEVSSHAIDQHRTTGLSFYGGVFTNLTHDHLDYHNSFEEYLNTKKKFFDALPETAFAITNIDDKNGKVMLQNSKAIKQTYALKSFADFKCSVLEKHIDGMLLRIDNAEVWTKFIGLFNAYNLLAVYATAINCDFDKDDILIGISKLEMVEGRFEAVRSSENITAIIDYAHTPDALENVLITIKDLQHDNANIITVIGCGGDRDKTKRPIMAAVAAKYSNKVILTSDNPRSENPEEILNDMENGIDPVSKRKTMRISDRKEAIRSACINANHGDIILVAGKGHEKYQEINGVRHPFDDKEIVKQILT